jgi:hypothetical protein
MTLDKKQKRELTDAYRQTLRPMGIYQVRNLDNGKIFVGISTNLDASRNRHEFTAASGSPRPPIPELYADWQTYGGSRFVFEVLDRFTPADESATDAESLKRYRQELDDLLDLWLDKLQPYGDKGYNKPKLA